MSKLPLPASCRSYWITSRLLADTLEPEIPFSAFSITTRQPCCWANLRHLIFCMGMSLWSTCPLVDTR